MSERIEILVSGFGGQGVVRIGQALGLAAVLEGLHTTMLISHGTETRGGYVRSQVVISHQPVDSPVVESPTLFCALSKAAYAKFYQMVRKGVVLYDPAFVQPAENRTVTHIPIAARELAVEKLGNEIYANMIAYGKMIRILNGTISRDNAIQAIKERIPRFIEENVKAFELGFAE